MSGCFLLIRGFISTMKKQCLGIVDIFGHVLENQNDFKKVIGNIFHGMFILIPDTLSSNVNLDNIHLEVQSVLMYSATEIVKMIKE